MTGIVLLFALGIICLFFEVIVPGAVLGVIGGILMLAGSVLAFVEFGVAGGTVATVSALGLTGFTVYFELFLLPKTKFGKQMFLETAVKGTSHAPLAKAQDIVGKTGIALTTLAPSGFVLVDGRKYEASSQDGLLAKDTPVKVSGLDTFRLIVSKT